MNEKKWKWLAYLLSNGLMTQHVKNCSEVKKKSGQKLGQSYLWQESPEGFHFWQEHWKRATYG